ncbi:MAG: AbrB/MazE/SpoVT family DNA-binding domain-containing protein [Thermoplasmataceae archaeon]
MEEKSVYIQRYPKARYIRIIAINVLMPKRVIDVSHITIKGKSMRVTIPKKVSKELELKEGDIIIFYDDNGIKIERMKNELE